MSKLLAWPRPSAAMPGVDDATLLTATLAHWQTGQGRLVDGRACRAAASCLVEPGAGDLALLVDADDLWVVAVLVASGSRPLQLAAPHVALEAESARIEVAALETRGRRWSAVHDELQATAGTLTVCVGAVHGVVTRLSTWVRDAFAWRGRSIRDVEEVETVRCGQFDVAARDLLALSAHTGIVTARGLMKIDGEQITVG
ncbi:DUF3540 domain-containing protein [Sphingomonas sp. NPDC079357]|uniref:DUF3540 domain-containing protein n=1 Tax=Sphingomonas sp. NPDC079357 TaxID=3364518 RepID=UPI00384D07B2